MDSTTVLLNERAKTHGNYTIHAGITQELKRVVENSVDKLSHCQLESVHMIFHKIGRICAGDPNFKDHWDDIAGYAKLVADQCPK